ncbi:MAG TPA: pyridoxal phosphate-dependent aminotransferase, partial [Thermoanaerobaculia bacterium]|nr:pyridoxal phosphate-dependent aminotransferase [Thermoanaerobaculia bacterium]
DLLDLTETNPTRVGLVYPHDELADALARAARAPYDPDPRGVRSAREAVILSREDGEGPSPSPDDLILTASTSEAYSFLFKLLTDPGDEILTATPGYPLLEHLASLEQVALRHFPLEFHRRWELHDVPVTGRTKAIVVVNPNNPTGSFVTPEEQDRLARHNVPILSDEVFLDYPLDATGTTFQRTDVLTFTLGGLSKSAGLPHFKLGWIRVSGPGKEEALEALELIADNFLSVATPVQVALPELLRIGKTLREAIGARTRANLGALRAAFANIAAARVLPVEGGWSAVIRVPRVKTDEELAIALLDRGVVVQPGYFFDFPEGYIVVSLLPPEDVFAEGVTRIASALDT